MQIIRAAINLGQKTRYFSVSRSDTPLLEILSNSARIELDYKITKEMIADGLT